MLYTNCQLVLYRAVGYGHSKGAHLFSPPRDKTEFQKWVQALGKNKELVESAKFVTVIFRKKW